MSSLARIRSFKPLLVERRLLSIVYYLGLTGLLGAVMLGLTPPQVAHNSEAYLVALLLSLWIQFVRPRLLDTEREWPLTLAAGIGCFAIGMFLTNTRTTTALEGSPFLDFFPGKIRTLNEPFLALALLIPYVQFRRPLPAKLAAAIALGVLTATVAFNRTVVVPQLAEFLVIWTLAPVGFDLVDRGILDRAARTSLQLRLAWYISLLVLPIAFLAMESTRATGIFGEAILYANRTTEGFVSMLIVELYFAVGRRRTGQRQADRGPLDVGGNLRRPTAPLGWTRVATA